MKEISTPHIKADYGDFAETVLMPGDPLRSRFIAENFIESARLVNNVRGVQGYTGTYKGTPVSVMASGMGMPSIGIYSYELFKFFGVENIIRVGSAGAIQPDIKVLDIIFGMAACTDSNYVSQFSLPGTYSAVCDYTLLKTAVEIADKSGFSYHVGNIVSTDTFYRDESDKPKEQSAAALWGKMGVLALEMEAAALYMNAARLGKRALAICTVSDHVLTGETTTSDDRHTKLTQMVEVALETAVKLK